MKNNLLKICTFLIFALAVFTVEAIHPVYAAEGDTVWAKTAVSHSDYLTYYDIATDSSGNSYIIGEYDGAGAMDLGNGVTLTPTSASGVAILVKYNASGVPQWVKSTVAGGSSRFEYMTMDADGNIYVIGDLNGTGSYDFGNSVTATGAYSYGNMVVLKYNSSGVPQWAKTATSPNNVTQFPSGITTDTSGNVYVTTSLSGFSVGGTVDFGNSVTCTTKNTIFDGVIVKYSASGVPQWVRSTVTAPSMAAFYAIRFDASGNYYLNGSFLGQVDFGNGVTITDAYANQSGFVVKYNAAGVAQWAKTPLVAPNNNEFKSIAFDIDQQGNVYTGGYITGTSEFDFGNNVKLSGITADDNAFIIKYNSSGVPQWATTPTAGTPGSRFLGLKYDGVGNLYAVGEIQSTGSLTFGGSVSATGAHAWGNALLVKYTTDGTPLWAKATVSAPNQSTYFAVSLDGSKNIYAAGELYGQGEFNFGNSIVANGVSPTDNGTDLLVKYESAPAVAPTVTTEAATGVGATTATVPGNVTSDGGSVITERGVVYSSSNNTPTTSDSKQTTTGTTGAMSVPLSGLSVSTQYYARAYATNSVGTSYGSVVTFTTTASANVPTVTTTAQIPAYGATTAQVLGDVTADGGATITERGVVYSSTNNTPTTSDSKQTVTGTTGAMTVQVSGLTPYTTYYVRAFATNSAGTGYGSVVSFRTIPMTLQNVYFTFGKLQYGKYAAPSTVRTGDNIYLKNFDPKKIQLLAISLYDYTTKGNQCYTRSWKTATSMYMKTCGLLPTKRKYAFIFTFKDVATGVVVKKYFVINTISAGTITL